MKLRAIRLMFAVVFLCSGPALLAQDQAPPSTQTPTQEQSPQPNQTPSQEQPPASAPEQNASPAPSQNTTPEEVKPPPPAPTRAPGHKAGPTPKPPVLRHTKRKSGAKKTSSAQNKTADKTKGETGKVVVRNGGAKEGGAQLAPATSPAQAQHQRATAAQLMARTDANLKRVEGRQLTPAEQSMLDEIRSYLRQARAASDSGDTSRAQTLAYKARLLSDELARK